LLGFCTVLPLAVFLNHTVVKCRLATSLPFTMLLHCAALFIASQMSKQDSVTWFGVVGLLYGLS